MACAAKLNRPTYKYPPRIRGCGICERGGRIGLIVVSRTRLNPCPSRFGGGHGTAIIADMAEPQPLAVHEFQSGEVAAALEFLKRTRNELRTLRQVLLWSDRFQVFDVNRDFFEIRGIGYADKDI